MPSRPKSARKSSTDAESASKASNDEAVMNIPPAADSGSVGPTANMIGAETNQENAKSSSPESIIPVEAGTPAKEEIAGSDQNQGLGPTPAESSQQTRQAQPSFSGYRQSEGLEHAEPYPPKRHNRSAASAPATPFNYNTIYSSYVPRPSANPNESVGVGTSAPPFSYPSADTTQTQTQLPYFPRQSGPVPAPASAPAGYFTPYQDYQPAQTYAPRSYPYTGHLYPAYGSQQAPHAGQARDELHRGRGATSQRQTGQSAAPFPPNAPPVIPPVTPYYAPYVQHPSRKTDAFVANDPWRPHVHRKHQKEAETFDDIPLPPTSQPPWMPHGPRHRMASPQVPQPVIPPVYQPAIPGAHMYPQPVIPPVRPPANADSDSEPFINPSPIVIPEPASTNSSPPRRQGSLSSERSSASGSPRPAIIIPSPRLSSIHSSPLQESVGSSGLWETSSPVADPVARPGHNDEETTKFSRTSWSTEIISRPSDDLTTPLPPSASSFRRAANKLKRPFKTVFHKPGNLSPQSSSTSSMYQVPPYYTNFPGPPPFSQTSYQVFSEVAFQFIVATLPSQVYLNILLRLPSLYFSRVARIFEEADLTLPELKKMALETAWQAKGQVDFHAFQSESNKVPQYDRLRSTWESFIDSVMREWKTFNIISVLLLSAILTILQIDSAADDPVTRYAALFSMICALVSLLFGCMYIIRFGSMRKTYKAAEWALEAKKTKTSILWNVWVMLAMPAIWLTWSIILYIACIMSFIWRTSPQDANSPNPLSTTILLVIRTVISSILGIGFIYGVLILRTFRRYGQVMDRAWKLRIDGWIEEKNSNAYAPAWYNTPFIPPAGIPLSHSGYPPPPPNMYEAWKSPESYITPARSQRSNSPILLRPDNPIYENRYSSTYSEYPNVGSTHTSAQTSNPPNRSPPESMLSSLNLDWGAINSSNKRRRSTDSYYSTRSTEGPSSLFIPGPVIPPPSFSRQGRNVPLAMPPATYLPAIPGSPISTSVASYKSRTPPVIPAESISVSRVEKRQEHEHEQRNESILGATLTESPLEHGVPILPPSPPSPVSDRENSFSRLDITIGGPSNALAGTPQRTEAGSSAQDTRPPDNSTFGDTWLRTSR